MGAAAAQLSCRCSTSPTSREQRTRETAGSSCVGASHEHILQPSVARPDLHQRSRGAIADVEQVALIVEDREDSRRRRVGGQTGRADERPAGRSGHPTTEERASQRARCDPVRAGPPAALCADCRVRSGQARRRGERSNSRYCSSRSREIYDASGEGRQSAGAVDVQTSMRAKHQEHLKRSAGMSIQSSSRDSSGLSGAVSENCK